MIFDKKKLFNFNFIQKTFPSGELDLAEFNKVYQNFFPNGNPEKYAKFAFKVFDKDNNGKINFSEFIATTALSMKSSKFDLDEKGYEFAFDLYDHDKNEKVDKKEALTLLTAIYELKGEDQDESPETRVEKLFTKHDTNKNGYLDKSEFIKALSLDPNLRKHFLVK